MATGLSKLRQYSRVVYVNDSANVASLHYNPAERLLIITYHTGIMYEYQRVSAKEFGEVVSAESVGQAVNRIIKPKQTRKLN